MVVPRPKYTWFAQFHVAPGIDIGNYLDGVRSGKVLAAMVGMDVPHHSFETETLVSYNKTRLVPKKVKWKPVTIKFHDDSTSFATGLWHLYRTHYAYSAQVAANSWFGDSVIPADGPNSTFTTTRDGAEILPSLGMKVRPIRHFFDEITLFNLGTAPNSINIYHLVKPTIVDINHDSVDYTDRAGQMRLDFQFELEGYWEEIAQDVRNHMDIFAPLGYDFQTADFQINLQGQFSTGILDSLDSLAGLAGNVIDNAVRAAPGILTRSVLSGKFSASQFTDTLVNRSIAGTPLQTVQSVIRSATLPRTVTASIASNLFSGRGSGNQLGSFGNLPFTSGTPAQPFQAPADATSSSFLATSQWETPDDI